MKSINSCESGKDIEKKRKSSFEAIFGIPEEELEHKTEHLGDHSLAESNSTEEWMISGITEQKSLSESMFSDEILPTPRATPREKGRSLIPSLKANLSSEKQLKIHLHDFMRAISWGNAEEAEKARQRILNMSSQFSLKDLETKIQDCKNEGNQIS